jgi:hypothetical protein
MTVNELITALREDFLDDLKVPYGWSNQFCLRVINEAERQICRRAYPIHDKTTVNDGSTSVLPLCSLSVKLGVSSYTLSKKIIKIDSIQLALSTVPLIQTTRVEMENWITNWGALTGTPEYFIFEETVGSAGTSGAYGWTLRLIPIPVVDDTATIQCWRFPLVDMNLTSKTSAPEIDSTYHYDMLEWAAHLAFRKPDSDTINLPLSGMYAQSFTAKFGPLPSVKQEVRRRSIPTNMSIRPRAFGF